MIPSPPPTESTQFSIPVRCGAQDNAAEAASVPAPPHHEVYHAPERLPSERSYETCTYLASREYTRGLRSNTHARSTPYVGITWSFDAAYRNHMHVRRRTSKSHGRSTPRIETTCPQNAGPACIHAGLNCVRVPQTMCSSPPCRQLPVRQAHGNRSTSSR